MTDESKGVGTIQNKAEAVFATVFVVETKPKKSLNELMHSTGNLLEVDRRITEESFPNFERDRAFNAKIIGVVRDSFLEDEEKDLIKKGLRFASLYELLEFLPQCPEIVEQLYALGSILEEDDKKLCVKIVIKDKWYSILLEELGHETIKGVEKYYAPWPAAFLAVQEP